MSNFRDIHGEKSRRAIHFIKKAKRGNGVKEGLWESIKRWWFVTKMEFKADELTNLCFLSFLESSLFLSLLMELIGNTDILVSPVVT